MTWEAGVECSVEDVSTVLLDEPFLSIVGSDSLVLAEDTGALTSSGDSLSSSGEDDVEVHTEDTSVGVVLDSKINMFINTESEVT